MAVLLCICFHPLQDETSPETVLLVPPLLYLPGQLSEPGQQDVGQRRLLSKKQVSSHFKRKKFLVKVLRVRQSSDLTGCGEDNRAEQVTKESSVYSLEKEWPKQRWQLCRSSKNERNSPCMVRGTSRGGCTNR